MKISLQAKIEINEKPYNIMVDYIYSILMLYRLSKECKFSNDAA